MIYSDSEKQIYKSPVSTLHDPVQVCHLLTVHSQGNWNTWVDTYFNPQSEVERAHAALELARVGRIVFSLKPLLEEGGHGDGAVLEVIDNFMEYVSKKE